MAQGSEFKDPPTFSSQNHELNLLMVAKAKAVELGDFHPVAWIYEVCPRKTAINDQCPATSVTSSAYGGVRLQLFPGDHLRIRLVNQLPPAPKDAENATGSNSDVELLGANPTNLDVDGLIVEPRKAGNGIPTYGAYVYVAGYPKGKKPGADHKGLDLTDQPIDYDIYIPANHPSGLFWFHPDVNGLALNQISQGLAGIITIGDVEDYLSDQPAKRGLAVAHEVRDFLLQDIQLEDDGKVVDQQDSEFCSVEPDPDEDARHGFCEGQVYKDENGHPVDYTDGKWFFTINGQVYPRITVHRGTGEIWRLTNASANRIHALSLVDDVSGNALKFQVLAIDGMAIDTAQVTSDGMSLAAKTGGMLEPVPCGGSGKDPTLCATEIRMPPGSRIELWISSGQAETTRSATLVSRSLTTGLNGDNLPSVELAHLVFDKGTSGPIADTIAVSARGSRALRGDGVLSSTPVIALPNFTDPLSLDIASRIAAGDIKPADPNLATRVGDQNTALELTALTGDNLKDLHKQIQAMQDSKCKALPPGHKRRILFGSTNDDEWGDDPGLGYEEVDAKGEPVRGTFRDIRSFDTHTVTICLPLAAGNKPVTEEWELVNLFSEDHSFHIHQAKFEILPNGAHMGDGVVMMDSVSVPRGSAGCVGHVAGWLSRRCAVNPVRVAVHFSQVGYFTYGSGIMEDEDDGVMANIRVVANH
jgi:FtsP/CotA-like multicopper oxidase with cupredoxin domain